MPLKRHKSVLKRVRQNIKRRERNRIVRGSMRAVLKAIRSSGDPSEVMQKLSWNFPAVDKEKLDMHLRSRIYSVIDKAHKKGVIHKNKAARHKAQVSLWFQNLSKA